MTMLNPFQCILFCSRLTQGLPSIILAASGPSIYSVASSNGALISSWPRRLPVERSVEVVTTETTETTSERPGKRRKLSTGASSESSSTEIVVENGGKRKKRTKGKLMGAGTPAVIKLIGTSKGNHAIAVTGEDKCIRVFDILGDGSIEQISERAMPKRPCSIALTTDETTILCADKFGDVYALPFNEDSKKTDPPLDVPQSSDISAVPTENKFVPAANNLTVHTKTNQRALLNQQKAASKKPEKKVLAFSHQLLLGHVSLLTDLACVTVPSSDANGSGSRDYIITADRDEHIRVSRGLPQSHVIENYCLGHTSFVSKLCVPKWNPNVLVSGGGDNCLLLWNWLAGLALQKIDIDTLLRPYHLDSSTTASAISDKVDNTTSLQPTNSTNVSVSGLWAIQRPYGERDLAQGDLLVACEGVPVLLVFSVNADTRLGFRHCLHFQGNVLDLAHDQETGVLFVALDNAHLPWSIDELRDKKCSILLASCRYSKEHDGWAVEDEELGAIAPLNAWANKAQSLAIVESSREQSLCDTLYGIENLRKRGNED